MGNYFSNPHLKATIKILSHRFTDDLIIPNNGKHDNLKVELTKHQERYYFQADIHRWIPPDHHRSDLPADNQL